MPSSITITDKQHVSAGITLLDADGQPFATKPEGVAVTFESSDPSVAAVTVAEDGLNIDIASGIVGSAVISATATLADGTVLADTLAVAVANSDARSLNFTVGAPADEA